jgi:hypothetical protein
MTESPKVEKRPGDDLEKRLGELERRHDKTRKLLVDVLSLTVSMLAALYFKPESAVATICIIWGAMAVTSCVTGWLLGDESSRRDHPQKSKGVR